jgi:Tfp pilus assembly protein PilO
MTSIFANLNLRPQERRLVVFVGIVVFVVLNIWLVWPHFGDWGATIARRERAQKTLDTYLAETAKMRASQIKLRELESAGSSVVPEEQELDLVRTIDSQARLNRLTVIQSDPRPKVSLTTQTNRFFEEQYETIHVTSDNEELINFLVSLTSSNSLIRVKDLSLKLADAAATKLDGQMTLVASYQRSKPAKLPPPAAPVVTNRPVATASVKPGTSNLKPALSNIIARTNKPGAAAFGSNLTNKLTSPRTRLTNQPVKRP